MKKLAIGLAIVALAATAAQAATYTTASFVTTDWTTAGAWGTQPGYPGSASIDTARIQGSATIDLTTTVPNQMANINIGRASTIGTLNVQSGANLIVQAGGNLNVGDNYIGYYNQNAGTVNVGSAFSVATSLASGGSLATINGGSLTVGTTLWAGKFGAGTLTVNGGTILTRDFRIGDSNTVSQVNLNGGTVEVTGTGAIPYEINPNSVLSFQSEGTLIIDNNFGIESLIAAQVAANDIIWDNGSVVNTAIGSYAWDNGTGDYLHYKYDFGTNKSTVWVNQTIPEPATVGMLGLGSLIVLLVRRMRG
jgi:hypothetical protein